MARCWKVDVEKLQMIPHRPLKKVLPSMCADMDQGKGVPKELSAESPKVNTHLLSDDHEVNGFLNTICKDRFLQHLQRILHRNGNTLDRGEQSGGQKDRSYQADAAARIM